MDLRFVWTTHKTPVYFLLSKFCNFIVIHFQTVETRGLRKQGSQISSRTSSVVSLDPLSLDGSDPLSHFAKIDSFEVDPLTKIVGEHVSVKFNIKPSSNKLLIATLSNNGR